MQKKDLEASLTSSELADQSNASRGSGAASRPATFLAARGGEALDKAAADNAQLAESLLRYAAPGEALSAGGPVAEGADASRVVQEEQMVRPQPMELPSLFVPEAQQQGSYSLEDLQFSWLLFVIRVFHAWAFLLANVTVAGNGINTFLNMFVEFTKFLSERGRVLEEQDCSRIAHLICRAILLTLVFAGCLQRGWWLLMDCLQCDMFINYRRTLCLEGPGPGDFPCTTRQLDLLTDGDKRRVHRALTSSCALDRDVRMNGSLIPKGSQLLALWSMAGRHRRDDLLEVAIPAQLEFKVNARPAAFSGVGRVEQARAWADMGFQCLIFLSLDVIPLAWSIRQQHSFFDILSLRWLTQFATVAIWVCLVHIGIYFVVSTLIDYVWKAVGIWRLTRDPTRPMSPARSRMEEVANSLRLEAAYGPRELRGNVNSDDHLSLCVILRNLLSTVCCHWVLFFVFVAAVIASIAFSASKHDSLALFSTVVSLLSLGTLANYRWRVSGREMAAGFENIGRTVGTGAEAQPWVLWFRTNCGVSPLAVFCQEMAVFLVSGLLIASAANMRLWVLMLLCFPVLCWGMFVMSASMCMADKLWMFVLGERLVFGAVTLVVAACEPQGLEAEFDLSEGIWSALALLLLTQLGMWRQGKSHAHAISVGFFVIIVMAIAAMSLMASSSETGALFTNAGNEWCSPGMKGCKEFVFPLHGQRNHSYEFCGLSWPMGSGDTVSDRCQDTRLSIVDFGQISTIAGFVPDTQLVQDNVEKYLPGWEIKHIQTYNLTAGTSTTFIHLARGSTSVIAVRGTSSAVEVLQDLNLWMRIGFLQLARKIGPSCYSTRGVLMAFTANRTELMGKSFQDLADYVEGVVANRTNRTSQQIYITGHSLGGGLATTVGAIFDIPAVTFSAPGLEATSAILRPSPKEIELLRRSVNVKPKYDVVPMVDEPSGTTLQIACPLRSPIQCHRLRSTMCELLSACGDGGGRGLTRGYNRSCSACSHSGQSKRAPACAKK